MADEARTMASISPILSSIFLNLAFCKILFLQMPISPYEMYISSISIFINLVILKWQGMEGSPFDTHPKTMTAAIVCFLLMVCSMGAEAEPGFRGVRVWTRRFVSWFWCLSLASVVSLLLPDSVRAFLYVLCFVPLLRHVLSCCNTDLSSIVIPTQRCCCRRVLRRFMAWFISMVYRRRRRISRLPV